MTVTEALPVEAPTSDLNKRVASIMRTRVREFGITTERLASRLDVPRHELDHWLTGVAPWPVDEFVNTAKVLGLDPVEVTRLAADPKLQVPTDNSDTCPSWCPDAGGHPWHYDGLSGYSRTHRVEFCDIPHHDPVAYRSHGIVACETYETIADGRLPTVVEITDGSGSIELDTPAKVDEFVAAIHRAATMGFADDESFRAHREAVLEMDAAIAECIARAGTPGNRADAALIRLRNAQDMLDATR